VRAARREAVRRCDMGEETRRLDAEIVRRLQRLTWSLILGNIWCTVVVIAGVILLLRH
jgi:hypothetical protein